MAKIYDGNAYILILALILNKYSLCSLKYPSSSNYGLKSFSIINLIEFFVNVSFIREFQMSELLEPPIIYFSYRTGPDSNN